MIRYVLVRLLHAIPLLLGIATITFFLAHAAPGDPIEMFAEQRMMRGHDVRAVEQLRAKYGFDQPVPVQYVKWLRNLARFDLGESFRYRRPISDLIAERIPYTLQLTVLAMIVEAALGLTLGIISAVRQYTRTDRVITVGSLIVYSIPSFWLALMLVLVFSVQLGWFPTSQTRSFDYELLSLWGRLADRLWHLVLPVFVLAVAGAAHTARYMRNKLLDVLSEDYVLAARARGLREHVVILRHALRNALIPVITIYGMALPFLLGGSVLIESVFAWPGMGTLSVEAVGARDYPLIMATAMLAAVLVVIGNLLADITYAAVDPRIQLGGARRVR